MSKTEIRHLRAPKSLPFLAITVPALIVFGALSVSAQSTLPLPTPGAAPAAPAAPQGDTATRARAAALAAKANVDVTEAWTRATGNGTTAPLFLHIVSAKDPDKLLSVEVSTAERVELRDNSPQAGGKSGPVPAIDIPAGGTVNFAPGGRYLNLIGLKAPLKEGDSFIVTFKFDKAGSSSTAVKVLGTGATGLPVGATARRSDTTSAVSPR